MTTLEEPHSSGLPAEGPVHYKRVRAG